MRTIQEYEMVCKLHKDGYNQSVISSKTNIPRSTVKDWLNKKPKFFNEENKKSFIKEEIIKNKELHDSYSYILGLYLGDGYINECKRTFRIRVFLDKKFSKLNEMVNSNFKKIFPNNSVCMVEQKDTNGIYFSVYNNELPIVFPQHGLGKKHDRIIKLIKWQKDILAISCFLKGLIHSDGCFYSEKISNKYLYERYMFSNKSIDLHELFQDICNKLNIEYDFQNKGDGVWQTRISKKNSVKKLKQIIGTKQMPL